MKKFTKFWQLMMVLLLSSSIVFAQEKSERITTSAVKMEVVKETTPDFQIPELQKKQLMENDLATEKEIKQGELSDKALEFLNSESKAVSYNQEKPPKMNEVKAKNPGQPTEDLFCPTGTASAIYSLPADGFTSAGTSDIGPGYKAAQQFFGGYDIDSIHWWGIRMWHDGAAWVICDEDPKDFEVIFYQDNAGEPGTVVGTYNATIVGDSSGALFSGGAVMEYTLVLPSTVSLSNGWISVQENPGGDPNCWFLWVNSGTVGPDGAQEVGGVWGGSGYSYSLCLYGDFTNTNDLVTSNVLAPNSGFLTATESVTMEIFNNGTASQSNIPVSFSLDGAAAVNEVFAGPLASGAYGTYTFTQTIDCSTTGTTYSLECCVNLVGDEDATNDCYTHSFASFAAFDCDWSIIGEDSWGDGWNGGYVEIVQDGILTYTYNGPPIGVGATPDTVYFGIWEGSTLDIVWTAGGYTNEVSYEIWNNFDKLIFSDGPDPIGTTGIAATCLAPTCFDPINLATTAITETGARAGWDPGSDETLWNFEWGLAGFTLGTGTLVPVVTSGYIFPALTPATYYDWYAQSDCGADSSNWVGPITFRTLLPAVGLPVVEDFEIPADGFNITQNNPDNGADWVVIDTMSYGGISSAFNVHDIDQVNIMELTVQVDLTAKINAQLSFWHIAKTEGDWDHCFVEISTDGGITFAPIPAGYYVGTGDYSIPDFNNDPPNDGPCFDEESYPEWGTSNTTLVDSMWMQEKFNLTPYNTFTDVTFRFRLTSDASVNRAGWMIDDIKIEEYTCPPVWDIALDEVYPTTATISWTSVSGSSNVEWDTTGFVQGTGNTLTGVASPQALSPLTANTTYDVYIQDDCGSDWMFYQFTTGCVECPVASTPEGEICGDSTNNGCNLTVPAFGSVSNGETICGNTWDDGSSRDTDWYEFTVTDDYTRVTVIAESEIAMYFGLLQQTVPGVAGCANITGSITPLILTSPCDVDTLIFDLGAPGTYYLFAGQSAWVGNVCPGARYWFSLDLLAITPPVATIDPTSFTVIVPELGSTTRDLTIGNTGDYPLAYSAAVEYAGATALLSETFDTEIPATWTQVLYSGAGVWGWTNTSTSFNGSDGNFAQANDGDFPMDYDVGLFTPAINMTGHTNVVIAFDRDFQDFAGYGIGMVRTYSGGTGVVNLVDTLLFVTVDDPSGGVHTVLSFDPSAYADPANVYIEFYYTDEAYTTAWHFKIDNVSITAYSAPIGWLTLDGGGAVNGTLLTATQDIITVGFDAAGLAIGTYNANIAIETNEPVKTSYTLPVTFIVSQSYTVSGTLTYGNNAMTAMDVVDVSLMEGATAVDATTTDGSGAFTFTTIQGTYSYLASTTKPWGGITTIDGVLASRFAVGLFPLSALQQLAADVNGGGVTTIDGILIKRRAVGLLPSWPAPDYVFENPAIVVVDANLTGQDFQTLCSGDVNRSFTPPAFCPLPTGLAIGNLTASSGEATWTSPAVSSNLEYGPTGFTLGTGTTLTGVTSPTTVPGAAGDVIDVYVQDDCGGLSQSAWIGPVTFTIPLPGAICATAITIPGVPLVVTGLTTCGYGDDYSSADACGSSYMNGDDYVFEYTPGANISVDIVLTNTLSWTGVFVTDGCPDVGVCVGSATASGGNPAISALDLTGGVTYYIIISTWPTPDCTPFDISIAEYVPPTALVPPYLEGFDTFLPADWTEASAGTPATGPSSPGSGNWTNDIWLNVTGGSPCTKVNLYSNTTNDWLISPEFDLSGGTYNAIFDVAVTAWGNSGPSDMGSDDQVQFVISNDGGATWVVLATYNQLNKPTELGQTETISLAGYTGTSVFFAFWADDGLVNDAEDYDFMVDTFKVE